MTRKIFDMDDELMDEPDTDTANDDQEDLDDEQREMFEG